MRRNGGQLGAGGMRGPLRGVTDGSAGSNEPGATREEIRPIREREQRAAAEVSGCERTFLGEPDGMLEVTSTPGARCREVRRLRPEVIVAPDPSRLWSGLGYINHWDHKQAGVLALTAIMPDAPTRLMFPELEEEGLEPFEVPNLWLSPTSPIRTWTSPTRSRRRSRRSPEHASEGSRGRALGP